MLTRELAALRQELGSPRLSHLRSTLGLGVASAALRPFDEARPPARPTRPRRRAR